MFGATNLASGLTASYGSRTQQEIVVNGNAQIDTAQSKFGGSSVYLDGVNDSLSIAGGSDFVFDDDFTFEFWVRIQDQNADQIILSNRPTTSYSTGNFYIQWDNTSSKFQWGIYGFTPISSTNTFSYNTWYHILLQRDSSRVQMYVNGQLEGSYLSTADSNDVGTNGQTTVYVGLLGSTYDFLGHIDELRLSQSARYPHSTGFTAPTAPFTNDTNTVLLMHADGSDTSTTITDDNS